VIISHELIILNINKIEKAQWFVKNLRIFPSSERNAISDEGDLSPIDCDIIKYLKLSLAFTSTTLSSSIQQFEKLLNDSDKDVDNVNDKHRASEILECALHLMSPELSPDGNLCFIIRFESLFSLVSTRLY
jgi:hypothetical protein